MALGYQRTAKLYLFLVSVLLSNVGNKKHSFTSMYAEPG